MPVTVDPATSPRIALIHATRLAIDPITQAFERHWPQARRMNLLDDSLSADLARQGRLDAAMVARFDTLARYAQGTGAQAILFTCSAFGPAIESAGRATGLPTLKPNEAMFDAALAALKAQARPAAEVAGPRPPLRAALVATFEPSIASMHAEFSTMARAGGLDQATLHCVHVPGAMQALAAGDAASHDGAIAEAVAALPTADADPEAGVQLVMLAQFSMAAAAPQAQARCRMPVLTSPDCAVAALRAVLVH